MKKIWRKTKKHQKRIEKAGVKEKTKIKNFLKKVKLTNIGSGAIVWLYKIINRKNKAKTLTNE